MKFRPPRSQKKGRSLAVEVFPPRVSLSLSLFFTFEEAEFQGIGFHN